MKHFLLSILLSTLASSGFSQVDFPLENGRWVNRHRSYVLDPFNIPTYTVEWIDVYCGSSDDTLINGNTYNKIDFCSQNGSIYHAALRDDNGAIYMVCKDSVNEYLLYDFNAQMGETLQVIRQDGSGNGPVDYQLNEVVVGNTYTEVINGTTRRVIEISSGQLWIEGVGCITGLFMESWINVSMYFRDLICMSADGVIQYSSNDPSLIGTSGACPLPLGLDEFELGTDVRIYPNPATSDLKLQFATAYSGELEVMSLCGEILRSYSLTNSTDFSVDVADLSAGSYFIRILGRGVVKFNKH